jgi:hypothetical protein
LDLMEADGLGVPEDATDADGVSLISSSCIRLDVGRVLIGMMVVAAAEVVVAQHVAVVVKSLF